LLDPEFEEQYIREPNSFKQHILAKAGEITHVIVDEIQKIPKLLNIVHQLIESTDLKFVLTGSSARKLKHGGANLLAGRAFVYNLYPFTSAELGDQFSLVGDVAISGPELLA
jgi:predicted AAA+ superfamily ATPase